MKNDLKEFFLVNFDEENKRYMVLSIDWKSLDMNYIIKESSDNKFICKAILDENMEIDYKISVYTDESDERYQELLEELKTMPLFKDNKKDIFKELTKRGYFKESDLI